jgi:hypothetical protein
MLSNTFKGVSFTVLPDSTFAWFVGSQDEATRIARKKRREPTTRYKLKNEIASNCFFHRLHPPSDLLPSLVGVGLGRHPPSDCLLL